MADEIQTEGQIGFGTFLQLGNGNDPELFADVLSELKEVDPPEEKADAVEATHMKSPGRHRERIGGLRDTGEFAVTGGFVGNDAGVAAIRATIGTRRNWRIVYPAAEGEVDDEREAMRIPAILTSFKRATPMEDQMTYVATFTPAGQPTLETAGD